MTQENKISKEALLEILRKRQATYQTTYFKLSDLEAFLSEEGLSLPLIHSEIGDALTKLIRDNFLEVIILPNGKEVEFVGPGLL